MTRCLTPLAAGLMLSVALAAPACAAGTKVVIPFSNVTDNFGAGGRLSVSIDGGTPVETPIDTGSTGYAVSVSRVPHYWELVKQTKAEAGYTFLSSSKRLWVGHWVPVTIGLFDHGREVATAKVPVLGVEKEAAYCPNYAGGDTCGDVPLTAPPKPINYLGIGFAREQDGQPFGTPDKNVLLNIATVNGVPVTNADRGYVIGPEGITVGFDKADLAGFTLVKLQPDSAHDYRNGELLEREYQPTPAEIFVDDQRCDAGKGTVLFDMGVAQMYLTIPNLRPRTVMAQNPSVKTKTVKVLAPAEKVAVNFGDKVLSPPYAFEVSAVPATGTTGVEPLLVIPKFSGTCFVNTGRHFFRTYRYLYDNSEGYVGFQALGG